jgi:hypothetical protein
MVFSQFCAVYINVSVTVDAVKIQHNGFVLKAVRQGKFFAVPSGSARQKTAFRFTVGSEVLKNTEIMRQRDICPGRILKVYILSGGRVSKIKFPAFIEVGRTLFTHGAFYRYGFFGRPADGICFSGLHAFSRK